MENISENTSRKRGRPPTIPERERRMVTETERNRSARHRNNAVYSTRVVVWAADDPRFEWLCSDGPTIMQGQGHMRRTILAELGRIEDAEDREAMALYLCEHQPTTRQAVAMIRQFRLGTQPPGSTAQLTAVLRRTINTYLDEHHPLTWEEVREALYALLRDVDQTAYDDETTED
jgi:hypothetical protein